MNSEDFRQTTLDPDGPGQEGQEIAKVNRSREFLGTGLRRRSPASMGFDLVEPWAEEVDGAELLDALANELRRFVVFSKWAAETFALWILHTYAYRLRDVTSYIGIESPERECGKSTLLTVLSQLVNRAAVSSNISSSALFRAIEELEPTLLIDEADTNLRGSDDLAGILNSGYTKATAFVWRMCYDAPVDGVGKVQGVGAAGRVARYSCWCPKAIAGIGRLPATLASRCIVVQMQRKMAQEACERLKRLSAHDLRSKCARFVLDHGEEIAKAEPKIPSGLTNRAADIWEPLLALAELAGGSWSEIAQGAALGLTCRAQERSPIGALLLDIVVVFHLDGPDRIFSRDLVSGLLQRGNRPWLELCTSKGITEMWLAQQLRPYGVRPKTMRIGDQVAKGYLVKDLEEVFRRYIPRSELDELKRELAMEDEARAERDAGRGDEGRGSIVEGGGRTDDRRGPKVE
jgi:putative DNA primase/helicase